MQTCPIIKRHFLKCIMFCVFFFLFRAPPCCSSQGAPFPLSKLFPLPSTTNIRGGGPFSRCQAFGAKGGREKARRPPLRKKEESFFVNGLSPRWCSTFSGFPFNNCSRSQLRARGFPFQMSVLHFFCLNCPRSIRFFWGKVTSISHQYF